MKKLINIFFIVILIYMNTYARPVWDQDPDSRTYRATANIAVENLAGNGVPNISGTFHFKMSFDTDGDGVEDNYQLESASFSTDQQGYAFVELFITVPSDWYNGWKNVYVSDISGQINGVDISVVESNDTQSNYYFNIYPSYVVIEDNDQDYVSDPLEIQLAEKFKPVLHRHPNDRQVNLENIESLMINSGTLKGWNLGGTLVYNSDIPPLHIVEYNEEGWIFKNSYGWGSEMPSYKLWRIDFNITKSTSYNGASAGNRPLYYHIFKHENNYYVQYWYFFTMNDVRGDTENDTWHEGDWEHVTIKLDNSLSPVAVNFYQHYGGHTKYPSACWWSSTNYTSSTPIQGYSDSRSHLHVWISKNGHASYNKNDLVYRMQVNVNIPFLGGEDFTDQCDYETNQSYYEYDFMEKLGEIEYSEGWYGYFPKGNSKYWLPFVGYVGDYYWNFVVGQGTYSPRMPAFRRGYYSFTFNNSLYGFGNGEDNWAIHLNPIYGILGINFGPKLPAYVWNSNISWVQNNSGL